MRRRLRSASPPLHRHSLPQLAVDAGVVALAYFLAFRLRFDEGGLHGRYLELFLETLPWLVGGSLVIFSLSRLYGKWWRYAGPRDLVAVARAVVIVTVALVAVVAVVHPVTRYTRSGQVSVGLPAGVVAMFLVLSLAFTCGVRVLARVLHERPRAFRRGLADARRVIVVGAGDGGRAVVREILRNPALGLDPVGFLDDDPRKKGMTIEGVRVLGDTEGSLRRVLDEADPDEVTIAIPSAPGTLRARVVGACRERGIPVRTLPTVFELLQGAGTFVRQVRDVRVEDVLGREPVRYTLDRVGRYLEGEVVLVTGAGGSVGSELCRQISRVGPRKLILLDHAEDNLFEITRELEEDRHVHPSALAPVLGDCKEEERIREVFSEHQPTVVFHAAAYKHVGLMETNAVEAVRNNALATRVVARVAGETQVGIFVLVSTDKAVSPATVMGASKALAEWAVEAAGRRWPQTRFASVRFGNVLGSSGSVVPIFRRQIAKGGPVTVTDERMTRYFMTIPEAVQLIIRSGSLARGAGEVFVLDMGEPVSIVALARAMIELSGLRPDVDIAIDIVGRRAGEKLHEEIFNPYERPQPTPAEKILLADREPLDPDTVERVFDEIGLLVLEGDAAGLARKVTELSAVRSGASVDTPA